MTSLNKEEIERIRHVNEMKRKANESTVHKLSYFPGANLVLLQKMGEGWMVVDETGIWYDDILEYEEIH